ncbi:Repetin [Streptomyces sp. TRM64462]|uniref:Repetin n=1 Tax=Streptomyces sp. TRM64462 TaxID=2741726 RepID=UPI001585D343|nr:Repetin [Streptomyces sp. TRM64462]
MNRRTKIAALGAALLFTAGAAGSAVASGEEGHRPGKAREAAALTGTAKLYRPAGDDITFSFDAHLAAEDNVEPLKATGTFSFSHFKDGRGGWAKAKVDCLVTGGKVAVVTGVVTETDTEPFRGKRVGITVHDIGKRDRLGYSWMTPETFEVPPCVGSAPFEKVQHGTGDFTVLPWRFEYPES